MEGLAEQVRRRIAAGGSRTARLALALGLLAGLACGWRPPDGREEPPRQAELEALGRLGAEFLAAYAEGDAERTAALFTGEAVIVPPAGPTCEGRDRIADYFDDQFREIPATAEFEVQETKVLDGWAFERIDVTVYWTDAESGEELEAWERWFWVLQRQADGTWKIARLIINAEEPGDLEDEDAADGRRA